jgi:hypothetical protein
LEKLREEATEFGRRKIRRLFGEDNLGSVGRQRLDSCVSSSLERSCNFEEVRQKNKEEIILEKDRRMRRREELCG